MNLPSPDVAKSAMALGSGVALGYIIKLGMADTAQMSRKSRRKLGIGLVLLAGSALAYHAVQGTRWDFSTF
jgi:hypothetical protein